MTSALKQLTALGQSVWLDDIRRSWLNDGTLRHLIAQDGVSGLTSNPTIFERAITHGADYRAAIETGQSAGLGGAALYEALVIEDIRMAADLLCDVWHESRRRDGFVSLEVSPHLAHDTGGSIAEAQRLWKRVGRPNVMIKIPGTQEGLPAIRPLIAQGINVNVTLLFSVTQFRRVWDGYLAGVEDAVAARTAPGASVASFFLSRIDTLVDARLDAQPPVAARELRGCAAIACARLAYREFKRLIETPRCNALLARGAQPLRLLWASTSIKDERYSDVRYLDALAGPQTVTTVPIETLTAYRDHGSPVARLEEDPDQARAVADELAALGIDLDAVGDELQADGVRKFSRSYDRLLRALECWMA
jgi:transaldolase